MPRSLPPSPSLETLRKQAKALLRAHKHEDVSCCATLRCLDRLRDRTNAEILGQQVRLQDCQHALARDYGCTHWAALKREVLGKSGPSTMQHLLWSDILADALRASTVPGEILVWRDLGAYGPTPAHDTVMAAMHAEILVEDGYFETVAAARQARASAETRLAGFHKHDEVVFWLDPCLYDHVILVQRLAWFASQDLRDTRLSLVYVRENLGRNTPEELPTLLHRREPVSEAQLELGLRAWQAYRSPVPTAVEELLATDTSALPDLARAFTDHLERFPSTRDGLGSVDRVVLERAAQLGRTRLAHLIGSSLGALPYLSDGLAATHARQMTFCPHPLLRLHDAAEWPAKYEGDIEITPLGREVLAGQADVVKLNGIERWLGGVHLLGPEARWRWDAARRRLVESTQAPVFEAIKAGDLVAVRQWAVDTGEVEVRTRINETPLICTAAHGHLEMVRELVRNGADINAQYDAGNTPLIVAAWQGHLPVVQFLLDQGALIATRNRGGHDALAWAAEHGHLDIVRLLVAKGLSTVDEALPGACESGHLDVVRFLVENGADLEYPTGKYEMTPLVAAAYKGHVPVVEYLLDRGADLHARADAALEWACLVGRQLAAAELLLARGANVNGTGGDGHTILEKATDAGARDIIELLLAHDADPNLPGADGRTALDAALARDDGHVVALYRATRVGKGKHGKGDALSTVRAEEVHEEELSP